MAILYVFTVDDPNMVGIFPPSVMSSSWYEKLVRDFQNKGLTMNAKIFDNETELNAWMSEFACTDANLLSDLNDWKTAHGVSYNNKFYSLDSTTVSAIGILS
jgi:hypothetical protein